MDAMEDSGIRDKKVAIFGLGDSMYTHFCGAVDLIVERVRECGGTLVVDPIRIDDPHDDHEDAVRTWAGSVAVTV